MAGGANKKFLKNPRNFIKNHIIAVEVSAKNLIDVANANVDANKANLATRGRVGTRGQAVPSQYSNAGIYDFDLIKKPKKGSVRKTVLGFGYNASIEVYALKDWGTKKRDKNVTILGEGNFTVTYQKPRFANTISAYWSPWNPNSCWSVQLGNDADFFFTPTMDGCSLAISSGVSPVVTHGNYRNLQNQGRVDQLRTVNEMTQHHTSLNVDVGKTFTKNQYAATHDEKTRGINRLVTVVGIRNKHTNNWRFFWQRREVDSNRPNSAPILQDRLVEI